MPAREISLVEFGKGWGRRPALVLTRELMIPLLTGVTVAPITTTIRGQGFEVPIPKSYGIDEDSVANMDNVITVPPSALVRTLGFFPDSADHLIIEALCFAYGVLPTAFAGTSP